MPSLTSRQLCQFAKQHSVLNDFVPFVSVKANALRHSARDQKPQLLEMSELLLMALSGIIMMLTMTFPSRDDDRTVMLPWEHKFDARKR